jgi:beta-lactamase regulating signal transducer with metallopeptidase domain
MIALALEALAATTVLMVLVLALRSPVRRAFGAEMAYLLWLLPVLRLALPPLPSAWNPFGAAPIVGVGERAMVLVAPIASLDVAATVQEGALGTAATWVALTWVTGALAILGTQLVQYRRFRARVLRDADAVARVGSVEVVESGGATGPLAFGLLRRVVAFPRDFAERYDAQERELALAHEIGHHSRGDLWANWIALALLALHWFNPVAWIAFRAFRADQEMANDAGVLARAGAELRHAYGCAIVKAAHGRALTPACHLNTVNDLKGRLRMLARARVSGGRAAVGGAAVALLVSIALVLTASGMPAAARVRASVERATGVAFDTLDHDVAAALAPTARTHRTSKVTIVEQGRTLVLRDDEAAAYIARHPAAMPSMPPVSPVPPIPPVPSTSGPVVPPLPPIPPAVPSYPARSASIGGAECDGGMAMVSRSSDGRQVVICTGFGRSETQEARRDALQKAREAQREAIAASREARQEAMSAAREAQREAMVADREARQEAMQASRDAQRERQAALRETHLSLRSAMSSLSMTRASLAADRALTGSDRVGALREVDKALANVRAQLADID